MTDVRDKKPASGFNRRAFTSGAAGAATLPFAKAAGAEESTAAAQGASRPQACTIPYLAAEAPCVPRRPCKIVTCKI
jgi:hypothetical protein